jgi:hypothetical protein
LNAAFAQGLLSEQTHSYRLGLLFESGLVDQRRLVGDLRLRGDRTTRGRTLDSWRAVVASARELAGRSRGDAPYLLALHGLSSDQLLIGRHPKCDIVVDEPNVSRRHAELMCRDGVWVIRDLGSTNGTTLNGSPVGRSELRPGDVVGLAGQLIQID